MIQFKGTPSGEVRHFVIKCMEKISAISAIVIGLVLLGFLICFWCIWPELWFVLLPCIVTVVLYCSCLAIPKINPQHLNVDPQIPNSVTIKGDHLERVGEGANSYSSRKMIDVKKVRDYGNFYYLTFYFPYKDGYFVCQKDLLVEGTLEEFEKLFEDKLERMV